MTEHEIEGHTTSTTPERSDAARPPESSRLNRLRLRRLRLRRLRHGKAYLYVLPAAALYGLFAVWPGINTIFLSFLKWDGISRSQWVGLKNYIHIAQNPLLYSAIWHSLVLILFFTMIPLVIGLVMTGLLLGKVRNGMPFFRTVFFLPQVLPLVAVGTSWRWIYSPDGVINELLHAVGLGGLARAWLGDYRFALVALGLIGTWAMSGLCMMLFLAGAQRIPQELHEAASMDGAGPVRRFTSVTVPGIRGEITIASVITTITALASFDLVYVTTNGGPADQTNVPGILVYRLAFNESNIGQASALAVSLTVLVAIVITMIRLAARERA